MNVLFAVRRRAMGWQSGEVMRRIVLSCCQEMRERVAYDQVSGFVMVARRRAVAASKMRRVLVESSMR